MSQALRASCSILLIGKGMLNGVKISYCTGAVADWRWQTLTAAAAPRLGPIRTAAIRCSDRATYPFTTLITYIHISSNNFVSISRYVMG